MPEERGFVLEALFTLRALVDFIRCMGFLVHHQLGAVPKPFPALGALKRPFPRVRLLVLEEIRVIPKGFPAITAPKNLLPAVQPLVLGEVRPVAEGFPARAAGIGLFPGVRPPVHDEIGVVPEAFPAFLAEIFLLLSKAFCWGVGFLEDFSHACILPCAALQPAVICAIHSLPKPISS